MKKLSLLILLTSTILPLNSQLIDDWQTSGITTVQGTIINYEKYSAEFNRIEIQVPDWTNAKRRTYFSNIDANGNFSLSFFLFNTQQVVFIYKNVWPGIIISPNDTLKMIINADSFPYDTKYLGKTSIACETIFNFQDSLQQTIFKISNSELNSRLRDSLSFDKYKIWRDSIYKIEIRSTELFIQQIQPETYMTQWFTSLVQLRYYWDLLRYSPLKSVKRNDERTDEKLGYLFSIIHSVNVDTLQYDLRLSPFYSPIVNALYVKVHQIATLYRSKDLPGSIPINGNENKSLNTNPPKDPNYLTKEIFPYYINASKTIENVLLRESVLAHYYSTVLENQNLDLGLDSILTFISDPEIKASLFNTYNSNRLRKSNQNSLKINSERSTLLDELKDKYKGYVVYLDFWGTWCTPCYESFKHVPAIKKAFKNQKLVFVYLCCHCNKEKWGKDIKNYNLDGEHIFLTSEQYAELTKEFNIIGVPRYIIIDKNGKVVNDNALRPWPTEPMQKRLIDELTKYLKAEN